LVKYQPLEDFTSITLEPNDLGLIVGGPYKVETMNVVADSDKLFVIINYKILWGGKNQLITDETLLTLYDK